MSEIPLSRSNLIGNYYIFWENVEFPNCIYMSLEASPGYGEGGGGAGVGEIINTLSAMEAGCFVEMIRIDELVENFPSRDEAHAQMVELAAHQRLKLGDREVLKQYLASYPWKFVQNVKGATVQWTT